MTRVSFSELPSTIRHAPRALCRSLSEEHSRPGAIETEVSEYSILGGRGRPGRFRNWFAAPEPGSGPSSHPPLGNQNPARPCGLLYGIWTLVTSLSEPFGCVA